MSFFLWDLRIQPCSFQSEIVNKILGSLLPPWKHNITAEETHGGYTILSNHWLVPNLPFLKKISNKTNYWLTSVSPMEQTRDIKLEKGHGPSHTSNYLFSEEVWGDINSASQTSFLIPSGMKYLSLSRGDTSKGPTKIQFRSFLDKLGAMENRQQ